MRRSRAPSNWPGSFFAARSWAGCTTNMFGFDLRQAHPRDSQAYPGDEHRQSVVGSATDPWRAPQARHRNRTDQRGQVHGQEKRPAISRLADVPSQSCRRHRRDGSVRRADNLVSFALRLVDCGPWPTADFVVWRHGASDLRMDRKSDHGSLRLGTSSPISDPRPGWGLWRGLHPKTSINGHSRSTNVAAVTLAKRIC